MIGAGSARPVGLHHDPAERRHLATTNHRQKVRQSGYEIVAHRAAQAARRQQHRVLGNLAHQQMVEPDLAELVDDHGRVGKIRLAEQMPQECRLAASEEAGQHMDRDSLIDGGSGRLHSQLTSNIASISTGTLRGSE